MNSGIVPILLSPLYRAGSACAHHDATELGCGASVRWRIFELMKFFLLAFLGPPYLSCFALHVIKDGVAFPTPAVLEHEISKTVEASGVEEPAVGTPVVASFIIPCD
jgi:hypothetical protein